MKLTKKQLHRTLQNMVIKSCIKAGSQLMKDLQSVKSSVGVQLQLAADAALPELTKERQLEILQSRIVSSACTRNMTVAIPAPNKKDWSSTGFTKFTWAPNKAELIRVLEQAFQRKVIAAWANSQVIDVTFGTWSNCLELDTLHPGVIVVGTPSVLYPDGHSKYEAGFNLNMLALHEAGKYVCAKAADLLKQAQDTLDQLILATVTCTTLEKLLEFIPEAEAHLPDDVLAAKPTKQLADPKTINDIRAKLKAGLPV